MTLASIGNSRDLRKDFILDYIIHMVNLAAEVFHHHCGVSHVCDLVSMIKSSLHKNPERN